MSDKPQPGSQPPQFWTRADAIGMGILAVFLAIVGSVPIAVAGARLTEGSREAALLFAVCYYGFVIATAILIFRALRWFFKVSPVSAADARPMSDSRATEHESPTLQELSNPDSASAKSPLPWFEVRWWVMLLFLLPLTYFVAGIFLPRWLTSRH